MSVSTVLVVEDDDALTEALRDTLHLAGYQVMTAVDGKDALKQLAQTPVDLVVSDIQMPNMDGHSLLKRIKSLYADVPVMLMTAYGTIQQAVDAMRDGAVDYLVKPFEAEVLVNMVSRYVGMPQSDVGDMVAVASSSQQMAQMARRVAESNATVMLTGESGVGKEVLARYIHRHSSRAEQPFVAINCAAIPENMLEATLFGYEKGAYTGAYKGSPGKFEQAQGGTLLLDEISEMDPGLQAKLLRVLQEKEVERLGGANVIELDVRVLATSNHDIKKAVSQGRFREDLYYRLNVFPLHILPLRERTADIIPLAELMLEKHALTAGRPIPTLSTQASERLMAYPWPGNVRELDNVLQRALILQSGTEMQAEDFHFDSVSLLNAVEENIREENIANVENTSTSDSLNGDLKQREWNLILNAISSEHGSRKATAERLGISQRTLRYKIARMRDAGITIPGVAGMETV